ncbi:NAD(P)-dependent oxidoreductase [Candidatus Pelagibacter ubique]|jgi:2-hydroxy-3-oxopropionate reductase|uniref:6-phosphogluconate dehydrogenase n=1 Tax=Pelagibacter ubique (strain HTCC1002) TaxID=314261 RepID=Q1V2H8_PELU1|nr:MULTISPECIES: NAD(P)-dependent oxidoreductase [Pelagibacter]MBT7010666.1 NAD(P)-dependent oxidoreductase [Flavobacteriaceae bacterium]MDA7457274.1 NAD(P)-dependent oxidoreductase [Candidatus Pelagibacter ubique]EAS84550.1 6-phosphogluconate dehydrogenase [Candidatus Pelagibacter ubique HTCC1002]MBL6862938.1 NAD(P)-dependent oxidoreductase [Candidatus Pelagibacter bacterium]MDA7468798.1 NAD(P)-dependent oxidoreductase [Candidatus Pelagibacter ubique]
MQNISFIGIGLMGFPMAKNLLKSGFNLRAYNRSQDKADRLKEFGAEISTSIKDVVTNSDVIITMLTDDAAVEKVMGSDEFISNIKEGATVIDMSSVNPVITKKYFKILKEKNINYLDAPVSGGTIGAEEASLAIMVGGDEETFKQCYDLLKILGNPTLVGPVSSGQISKLANQIIVGVTIGAVAEAVTLCEKSGTNPNKMIEALSGGWADSKILQTHGKRMINKDFTPKGKTTTQLKDMTNIINAGKAAETHLPISSLVKEMYKDLVADGQGNTDHSSLYKAIEKINKK